jgi:predicted enzyme related to lactoylglutathione lyase
VPPLIPPVTDTPTQRIAAGKFVFNDLVTQDVERAKAFYGALFGWTFSTDERYTQVLHDGAIIAGIVSAADPKRQSEWVGNLSVADVDRATARVRELGGVVERKPVDAPERGRLAVVSDPEGALLLLLRASGGDPPDAEPPIGSWLWRELWTHDPGAAARFYAELVGYASESIEFEGTPYQEFKTDGVARAGVVVAPPDVQPLWLPYVRVRDTEAIAARAEALGARIVMREETAVIFVDPTGAPIGVQSWAGSDGEDAEEAR